MITAHLRTETFRAPADPRDDDVVVGLIALEASRALSQELATWPKPGISRSSSSITPAWMSVKQ